VGRSFTWSLWISLTNDAPASDGCCPGIDQDLVVEASRGTIVWMCLDDRDLKLAPDPLGAFESDFA
jgi:hypothetical protein